MGHGQEKFLFARDERPIEEHVLALCRAQGLTLATAESCTGGLIAERLTRVPGSSDVFLGGIVAYANEVKERQLGVPPEVLEAHGAVVAIADTGVAGPGGGTEEKPVGLVYVAVETPFASRVIDFNYPADRQAVRSRAAVAGLHLAGRLLAQS